MRIVASARVISALIAMPVVPALLIGDAKCMNTPAPNPATISRTELGRSEVPGTHLETRLYLITYPPGAAAPVHHHPVEGIGYIIEGTARSAFGEDDPAIMIAGQSFRDKAMIPHTVFANADRQRPLTFVVAYTVKKGSPVLEIP